MSYSNNIQRIDITADRTIDLGANSPVTWLPADDMIVYGFGLRVTEAVHTATVTTAATVTFSYDAANAGTATVVKGTVSIGLEGIANYEESDKSMVGGPFKVTGGSDSLEWTLTTVIGATTTTGTAEAFVYAQIVAPFEGV